MIRASGPLDRRASTNTTMTDPTTPPLLTDEQLKNIEQNPECWSHAGPYLLFRSDKYDRALESAVRAPLLADIERLTRERDEARSGLDVVMTESVTDAVLNEKARLHVQDGHSWRGCWAEATELCAQLAETYFRRGWRECEKFNAIDAARKEATNG